LGAQPAWRFRGLVAMQCRQQSLEGTARSSCAGRVTEIAAPAVPRRAGCSSLHWPASQDRSATCDSDPCPGDVAGLVRGEQHVHRGQLGRLAGRLRGCRCRTAPPFPAASSRGSAASRSGRGDAVDPDAARAEQLRQAGAGCWAGWLSAVSGPGRCRLHAALSGAAAATPAPGR